MAFNGGKLNVLGLQYYVSLSCSNVSVIKGSLCCLMGVICMRVWEWMCAYCSHAYINMYTRVCVWFHVSGTSLYLSFADHMWAPIISALSWRRGPATVNRSGVLAPSPRPILMEMCLSSNRLWWATCLTLIPLSDHNTHTASPPSAPRPPFTLPGLPCIVKQKPVEKW